MDGNGECLAALAEDVMRSADVLERPAMLPKEPDETLARHRTTIQPESCTRQASDELAVDARDRRTRGLMRQVLLPMERTGCIVSPGFDDWVGAFAATPSVSSGATEDSLSGCSPEGFPGEKQVAKPRLIVETA